MLAVGAMTGAFCTLSASAESFEGEGTLSNPYLIKSERDLNELSFRVSQGETFFGVCFYQTSDIKFSGYFRPIGNPEENTGFKGTYDGGGHVLSNLRIDTRYDTVNNALFGALGGTLRNLGVESGTIEGANCATFVSSGMPGAVSTVYNCYTLLSPEGLGRNASIADNYNGSIVHCWAYSEEELPLVGYGAMSLVSCYTNGDLSEEKVQVAENNQTILPELMISDSFARLLDENSAENAMLHATSYLGWEKGKNHPVYSHSSYSLAGSGTREDPYLISTAKDLAYLSASVNGGKSYQGEYVSLTADIDLSCYENFVAIGTYDSGTEFAGVFDGNGYTISNLTMLKTADGRVDNNALFGSLAGSVVNLRISDAEIHGACCATFAVGGTADSRIVNCIAQNITLKGVLRNGGLVDNFAGKVASSYYGGEEPLAGYNATAIAYCATKGTVTRNEIGLNVGNQVRYAGSIDEVMNARLLYGALRISFDPSLLKFWEGGSPRLLSYGLKGEGTKENPYLISKPADLVYFAAAVNSGDEFDGQMFLQTADIDMQGVFFMPIGLSGGIARFKGVYDGGGHTISNLVIRENELAYRNALFGSFEGTLLNLGLESGRIYGNLAAGLVCEGYQSFLRNCYSKAEVYGFVRSGGLVDNFDGEIVLSWYDNSQKHPLASYNYDRMYACCASGELVSEWMDDSYTEECKENFDFSEVDEEFAEAYNEKILLGSTRYAYQRSSLILWTFEDGLSYSDEVFTLRPEMAIRFRSVLVSCYLWNVLGVLAIAAALVAIVISFVFEGRKGKRVGKKNERKDGTKTA